MQPATPARPATRAPSTNGTGNQQPASTSQPSTGTRAGASAAGGARHPAHGSGSWRPRVRSTTGYATPAMKVRRRTVSEQSSVGDDDGASNDNDATNDLESTPGLDSDIGDTPLTGASSRLAPSLPITPGTPLLRYVPRGAKQQGRLVPATSTPSKSHSRHHTSPLHRTGLSSTTFAPPVEVREAADDDDDEDDLEHTGPTVSNVEYGFRRLRLQSARSESTPESPTAESVIDRAEFDAKGSISTRKTPERKTAELQSPPTKANFLTPQPSAATVDKLSVRPAPATAAPTVRPGATWHANRRALSPTSAAAQASDRQASFEAGVGAAIEKAVRRASSSPTVDTPAAAPEEDLTTVRSCGSCEDVIVKQGVKVSPCGCSVCRKCFTSGMNVVCDVAGGVMRCPACTTTVEDFKTLHLTPDPKVVEAAAPPASKATKSAARQAALSIEDDGKPVLLRFDNASWDVTPEMIVNFLPAGALPEPAQNPHPIHLLIHPADGKTKDFFFVEVVSKKAAAAVIKCCQSTVLGVGKRARPVTITISNAIELQREIQPYDARTLQGILALCQAAYSTKKSYIKRKSFPFLYLMSILTRADLTGLEMDALVTFQGAALVIANVLESGVASPEDLALAGALYAVLLKSALISPVLCGPYIGVVPGPDHPLSRTAHLQQQQQAAAQMPQFHFVHPTPPMLSQLQQQQQQQQLAAYMTYPPPPPPGLVYPRINAGGPLRI